MDFGRLSLGVRLPDPAGTLQRQNKTLDLISELGDNYAKYHQYLATEVAKFGGRQPEPARFPGFKEYAAQADRLLALVAAEVVVRRCRGARKFRRRLDEDDPLGLIDDRYQLISVESGHAAAAPDVTPVPLSNQDPERLYG